MRYTNEFIEIDNKEVKQVNILMAARLYNSGKTIYLNACNMRINNHWTSPMPLNNKEGEKFNSMVNEYEYYNCCSERGKYSNFFTSIKNK